MGKGKRFRFTCELCGQAIPETDLDTMGKRLVALRNARGLTLREVGEGSHLSFGHLHQIEQDKIHISGKTAIKLACFYQVTTDYILRGEHGTD